MTYDGAGSIYALGMRLTKLDTAGAPLVGASSSYKTNALVVAEIGLEYRDGVEIEQPNGSGELCVYFKAPDTVKRGTISGLSVCTPDPNVLEFMIGGEVITVAGTAEVQTVTITGTPTGGTFTLTYAGQTTAGIAYNAAAAAVQTALEGLSNLEPGDVTVGGGPGPATPYTVTFTIAQGDVAEMSANGAGLTGGVTPAVAVTTTTPGSNLTDIGYLAPEVGTNATPNGTSIELWSMAVDEGAIAAGYPYIRWVIGRGYMKPAEGLSLSGEEAMTPTFEGWSNQNRNWGSGPQGDWPFESGRVWQFARVTSLPDLSPGFEAVV